MSASSYCIQNIYGHARKTGVSTGLNAGTRAYAVKSTARLARRAGKAEIRGELNPRFDFNEAEHEAAVAEFMATTFSDPMYEDFDFDFEPEPMSELEVFLADKGDIALEMSLMPGQSVEDVLAAGLEMEIFAQLRNEVRNTSRTKAFRVSNDDELFIDEE